jgi:hypothetical protein
MRRPFALIVLLLSVLPASADGLRGPLAAVLQVEPTSAEQSTTISLEGIVLIELGGDGRFFDAVELEITSPSVVSDFPGALGANLLGPVTYTERTGIADVSGEELLFQPIHHAGTTFFLLPLRDNASVDVPAGTVLLEPATVDQSPLALSVVAIMKGTTEELNAAEFDVTVRPVTRNLGGVALVLVTESGEPYDLLSLRVPEFELAVDGSSVELQSEYLMLPGLHHFTLVSETYQDQETTVGVERGTTVDLQLELLPALATVSYSAPRGARVYVDGEALPLASGDFTVQPGEHTIVVTVGDYTVTKRFSVEEGREYSISVLMDIDVEEIK